VDVVAVDELCSYWEQTRPVHESAAILVSAFTNADEGKKSSAKPSGNPTAVRESDPQEMASDLMMSGFGVGHGGKTPDAVREMIKRDRERIAAQQDARR
jgi:hypothetical protein